MKHALIVILAASLLLNACGAEKGVEVHEAWARPAAQGENGAVYFEIHNHASKPDALIGASTDVADVVEIHESKMNGDVMEMKRVESIPLEAYADVKLAPGGLHLMLVNLKKELNVSDEIGLTLHFKNFQDITLRVPVREAAAPAEDHSSADH